MKRAWTSLWSFFVDSSSLNYPEAMWDPLAHLVEYRSSDRKVQGSGLRRVGGGFHMYSWSRWCSAYVALKLKGEYHAYIQIKMYAPEKVNAKKKKKILKQNPPGARLAPLRNFLEAKNKMAAANLYKICFGHYRHFLWSYKCNVGNYYHIFQTKETIDYQIKGVYMNHAS